jgi:two-component system chemotaxis sensor kinase CheA
MTLFIDIYKLIEKADPEWTEQSVQAVNYKEETRDEGPKKILLIEDVMFFRTLVKGYLKSAGYEVITAENGKIGLDEFKKQDFDLIVCDIEMPVMDGYEFISAVRNILNNTAIPALALTALDSEEDIKHIQEVGFDIYEAKIDRERLLTSIAELLS